MIKFGLFVLFFSFLKVVRMMTAATVLMSVALIVCQIGGARSFRRNLGVFALVPVACLMGYSKVFYTGRLWTITNWMDRLFTEKMAVCYFGIAGILAVRYFCVQIYLRRNLCHMDELPMEESLTYAWQGHGPKIRVFLSKDGSGPYAGGILRPYIVIPDYLQNRLSASEWNAVLWHEALHIRQGHVLLLNVYAVLKILWWIHPLVYLCDFKLRENMEYSSDEGSIMFGTLSAYEYASVILKTLKMPEHGNVVREGIPSFSFGCFRTIKRRLQRLEKIQKSRDAFCIYKKKKRRMHGWLLAAEIVCVTAAFATSYPRYTKLQEISVYAVCKEALHPLTYDLQAEGFQAEVKDGCFHMSEQEFERFVSKYEPQGDYLVFSYDVIMKIPGVGGFGQAALVSAANPSEVSLLGRQEFSDQLAEFILKYLI